jgi:serine/threonine-protein phosphatase 5
VTYSKALELSPSNAILLANRAFAHLKLENYGSSVEDSSKAIDVDSHYIKVGFPRTQCTHAHMHAHAHV